MPITNVNEFDFTTEQLDYFEQEMKKYKVPFLYKIVMGFLSKYAKYVYPLIFLVIIVLALIHSFSYLDLFPVIKRIGLVVIFGTLVPLTIAWVWNVLKTRRACKKLGITKYQWDTLAVAFQITF